MSMKTTQTLTGADVTHGKRVRLYYGGKVTVEAVTVSTEQATAGHIDLTGKAEFGSAIATRNGVAETIDEVQADGSTAATNLSDTEAIKFTTLAEGDVLDIRYIDITTSEFVHLASAKDHSSDISGDEDTEILHGQPNELTMVGVTSQSLEFEEVDYNLAFMGACVGDYTTDSTGTEKVTTAFSGFKTFESLLAEEKIDGVLSKKYFYYGVTTSKLNLNGPRDGFYTRKFSAKANYSTVAKF